MTYSFDYFSPQANSHASWIENGMSYCSPVEPFVWLWKTYSCQCLNWYTSTINFISFQYYHTRTIHIYLPIYLAHIINIIDVNLPSQNHILTLWINTITTIHILWYLWFSSFGWTLDFHQVKYPELTKIEIERPFDFFEPKPYGLVHCISSRGYTSLTIAFTFTCHITR
jgi:hypothetical protein